MVEKSPSSESMTARYRFGSTLRSPRARNLRVAASYSSSGVPPSPTIRKAYQTNVRMSRPNLHKMQTPSRPFAHQPHPNSRFPVRRHPRKQRHPTSNNAHPSRAATPYSQSFVVPTKHRRPSVHPQPTHPPTQLPHPSPPPPSPPHPRAPHRPHP